jgi:hypothetical protein
MYENMKGAIFDKTIILCIIFHITIIDYSIRIEAYNTLRGARERERERENEKKVSKSLHFIRIGLCIT